MKAVAFNGSARKDGNTASLVRRVFAGLEAEGMETELVQLAGRRISGCMACRTCYERKDGRCVQEDDPVNGYVEKMAAADAIILASPVYFTDVTPEMKALIDRAGYITRANGHMLRRKVGAAVVAVRRAGSIRTFDTLNHFFQIGGMVVPGSSYWNMGIGLEPGDVEGDVEGMRTMDELASNMAWLMRKLAAGP